MYFKNPLNTLEQICTTLNVSRQYTTSKLLQKSYLFSSCCSADHISILGTKRDTSLARICAVNSEYDDGWSGDKRTKNVVVKNWRCGDKVTERCGG